MPQPPSPEPLAENEQLYRQGQFPDGPRLRPAGILREGKRGSWLVGKFVVLTREDAHHYTVQSYVDPTGIGLLDMAAKMGSGRSVIVHLTIIQPPPNGLPHEFQYLWLTPLKVTNIDRVSNEVWAIDLTQRKQGP
jgi:hypothetical protein